MSDLSTNDSWYTYLLQIDLKFGSSLPVAVLDSQHFLKEWLWYSDAYHSMMQAIGLQDVPKESICWAEMIPLNSTLSYPDR